jgi:hypothetical protein
MFKNILISALMLSAATALAEVNLVFELNEVVVQASETTDTPPHIYLTQNDKSLALQIVCKGKPTVMIYEKIPLTALSIPSQEDFLGEAKIDLKDCEKIADCVLKKSINKDSAITVSVNSETEAFSLDSLGENCK